MVNRADFEKRRIRGGGHPKKYRGANTAFIQKILDFATDNELKDDIYAQLVQYADSHVEVAVENMMRKARIASIALSAGMSPEGMGAGGLPRMTPVGGAPPGGGESFDFLEKPLP